MINEKEYFKYLSEEFQGQGDINFEIGAPLPSGSSTFIYRTDFLIEKGGKKYVFEVKTGNITSTDIIALSGVASDTTGTVSLITNSELKPEVKGTAEELGIVLFVGQPQKIAKEVVKFTSQNS